MKISAILSFFAVLIVSALPARAMNPNERLVYDVSWTGIKAGVTVQELSTKGNELHIVTTTRSTPWLDTFFRVEDRAESVVVRGSGDRFGFPRYFRNKISEGNHRRLKEARFDQQKLKVESKDLLHKTQRVDDISATTYDPLSIVYYVRTLDLVPGRSLFVDIYDCKKLWNTEVKVLKREEIDTPVGHFKTIVVQPLMKADGFFARTGEVKVWLTDDALKIPVMVSTKVKIGKIKAVLTGGSYWPQAAQKAD
ncbi:DUF3108 domain-containing protein [Geomonas sp. Red69]|uniref:DUF3108 domain-containing protein n=1 Tax=Geomonas diazotrophica TaxID=2843197 RepID=UPI001C106916|nr:MULTISPECIES: DUF3108 domain-containing protein [Geomonas]MBU5638288.1 DUF3108 domain-containing protein [Geomonas diazotrophica]QXE85811.1 DUF3108 domain-containing protein [Geomonas nitrogeniifigens]